MDITVDNAIEALDKWAKADSDNRAVICITFEKQNETVNESNVRVDAEQQNLSYGQNGNLVLALTTALQEDNAALASLVAIAVQTIQNKHFKTGKQ